MSHRPHRRRPGVLTVTTLETLAVQLAEELPFGDITQLAHACQKGESGLRSLEAQAAGTTIRGACRQLRSHLAGGADRGYTAGLLIGAAQARRRYRSMHYADVVWTGPASEVQTSRLTSAVVTELIDSAQSELLLVSFAAFPPASLTLALAGAAARGVEVTLLLEQPADNPAFRGGATFPAIPAVRWKWPRGNREPGAALHAKVIVVDRQVALVGSANLTSHAFEKNLECGILLRDPEHARAIAGHLDSLRATGVLTATL
jgi:cardiolipin synthase